jgi:hypothetical protein
MIWCLPASPTRLGRTRTGICDFANVFEAFSLSVADATLHCGGVLMAVDFPPFGAVLRFLKVWGDARICIAVKTEQVWSELWSRRGVNQSNTQSIGLLL